MPRDKQTGTSIGQELITLANDIFDRLVKIKQKYIPYFLVAVTQVDIDWLVQRLNKLPNFKPSKWMPLDGKYYAVPLNDWKEMAEWDITNYLPYVIDRFDCDKYALLFKARMAQFFGVNTVAVVLDYDAGHAYNIVFPIDSDPLIYEPQTDSFIEIGNRDTRFYKLGENYYIVI